MLEGVLFDVDGVLIDSEPMYARAVRETFLHYGVNISDEEFVRRFIIDQTNSPGIITDYGLKVSFEEVRERKKGIVKRMMPTVRMMPYALDLVDMLDEYFPLGVVSSAPRDEVLIKFGQFHLLDRFPVMVTGSDVQNTKPHPEPYQKGVALLGVPARNILVIEDNPSGVRSAKAAGCKVIGFPNGFTADLDFSEADRVVADLAVLHDSFVDAMYRQPL